MTNIPLGRGAYNRASAGEAEIRCENRYFESNPTSPQGAALLARPGTGLVATFGSGPVRRTYTKKGLFNGDLFVVSAAALYRYDGTLTTTLTGTVAGSGAPNFAWMKGIGYEYQFIADGFLLQYYGGGTHATGTLTDAAYDYSWTARTSAEDNGWSSVCWSPDLSLFCAVATSGTHRVMTSPDGVTWTARTAATALSWQSVCWAPELTLFVAVAVGETANGVMTSPDGTTWTARTTLDGTHNWRSVCWAPEILLLVAVADTGSVMTSPDGITWTEATAPAANAWHALCWSPELTLFVAVANTGSGTRVMTSPDGLNWSTPTVPDYYFMSVCWSADLTLFCAGAAGGHVLTSPDGMTWTSQHGRLNEWRGVVWATELQLFVAVGYNDAGAGIMTSPDGVTWTSRTPANSNQLTAVCWAPAKLMLAAVANTGTGNRVATSAASDVSLITGQIIEIGGIYYSWNSNVDAGAPDGTTFNPWLAALGTDDQESLANMAKLLNYNGTPGTDFSTALPGPSDVVTAEADAFTLVLTSIATDATGNTITTSVYAGASLSWGAATLTGGNVHALTPIDMPEGKALALAHLAGFVLVSVANTQKVFFVLPGETTIDALNFFEKESNPDNVLDMLLVGDQVLICGDGSAENWYATGDALAPFAPQEGRVYQRGVVTGTPVLVSDGVIFVGDDGKVYSVGYSYGSTAQWGAQRISDHGIEERVRRWQRAQQGLTP